MAGSQSTWHVVGDRKGEKEVMFSEQVLGAGAEPSTSISLHPPHMTLHLVSQQTFGEHLLCVRLQRVQGE